MPNNVGDKGHSNAGTAVQYSNSVNAYTSTDALRSALEEAKAALNTIRNASLKGCEYGYGKPEQFADELYRSHGDVHRALVKIDAALSGNPAPDIEELIVAAYKRGFQWCVENASDPEASAYVGKAARDYADYTMNAPSAGITAPSEVAK